MPFGNLASRLQETFKSLVGGKLSEKDVTAALREYD